MDGKETASDGRKRAAKVAMVLIGFSAQIRVNRKSIRKSILGFRS